MKYYTVFQLNIGQNFINPLSFFALTSTNSVNIELAKHFQEIFNLKLNSKSSIVNLTGYSPA